MKLNFNKNIKKYQKKLKINNIILLTFLALIISISIIYFLNNKNSANIAENYKLDLLEEKLDISLTNEDIIYGNIDAKITIISYASLSCHYCAKFYLDILPKIKENYIDKGLVRFVYRNFPLDRISLFTSLLTKCYINDFIENNNINLDNIDVFSKNIKLIAKEYHNILNILYLEQASWINENFQDILKNIFKSYGFTEERFLSCVDNKILEEKIINNAINTNREYNINSTPAFIINGKLINSVKNYSEFSKIIEHHLK